VLPFRSVPYQAIDLIPIGLTRAQAQRAAWWVDGAGRLYRGHLALGQALLRCRRPWPLLARIFVLVPPMSLLAALVYAAIVRLRNHLPGTTPACDRPEWSSAASRPLPRSRE
jgi:predicted DCC family thiol-disulfide oxidoreductase YuxK